MNETNGMILGAVIAVVVAAVPALIQSFVKSDKAAQIKIDMRAINVENGNIPIEFTVKTAKAFAKQMNFFF